MQNEVMSEDEKADAEKVADLMKGLAKRYRAEGKVTLAHIVAKSAAELGPRPLAHLYRLIKAQPD